MRHWKAMVCWVAVTIAASFAADCAYGLQTTKMMRELFGFRASLGIWQAQWPLTITDDEGWLTPAEREIMDKLQEAKSPEERKALRKQLKEEKKKRWKTRENP